MRHQVFVRMGRLGSLLHILVQQLVHMRSWRSRTFFSCRDRGPTSIHTTESLKGLLSPPLDQD